MSGPADYSKSIHRIEINGSGTASKFIRSVTTDVEQANAAVKKFGAHSQKSGDLSHKAFQAAGSRARRIDQDIGSGYLSKPGQWSAGPKAAALSLGDLEVAAQNALSSIDQIAGGMTRMFTSGVMAAAGVEESNARLKFGLSKVGLEYESILKKVDDVSLKTVMTRKEITGMVAGLAMAKINVFDKGLDNLTSNVNGKEVKISGAEVIGDASAKVMGGAERIRRSLTEAVSEGKVKFGKWLAEDLDLTKDRVKEYNKAMQAAKTPQEKFNALIREMNKDVGGAAQALGGTLTFALKQVDDWIEKIAFEAFKDSLPVFREAVTAAGDAILEFARGPEIKVIGAAFLDVGRIVAYVGGAILKMGLAFVKFIGQRPALARLLAVMSALAVGAAFVLAGFLATAAAIVAVKAALGAIPFVLTTIRTGLMALAPLVAKALLLGALATIMARMIVGGRTMKETWERVSLVVSAVVEGIRMMSGDTTKLSMKTAKALADAGLLDVVWTILEYAHAVKKFFEDASAAVVPYATALWDVIEAVMTFVSDHPNLIKAILIGWAAFKAYQIGMRLWAGAVGLYALATGGLTTAIGFTTGAFHLLKAAVLSNPIIAAIAAIATAAYLIYEFWGPISEFFTGLWDSVLAGFQTAMNWILDELGWVGDEVRGMVRDVLSIDPDDPTGAKAIEKRGAAIGGDDLDTQSVHKQVYSAETPGAYAARRLRSYIPGMPAESVPMSTGASGVQVPSGPAPTAEEIGRTTAKHMDRALRRNPQKVMLDTKRVSDSVGGQQGREAALGY